MKKLFALICAVIFLFGCAICEEEEVSQALPEELIEEIVEEIQEIEENIIEEIIEAEPEAPPEVEEAIIEESTEEIVIKEVIEEAEEEEQIVEELPEEVLSEEPTEEEEPVQEEEEEEFIEYHPQLLLEIIKYPDYYGDTAIFQLTLMDYPPSIEITEITWEYSRDEGVNWHKIKDANELTLEIVITKENCRNWLHGIIEYHIKEE